MMRRFGVVIAPCVLLGCLTSADAEHQDRANSVVAEPVAVESGAPVVMERPPYRRVEHDMNEFVEQYFRDKEETSRRGQVEAQLAMVDFNFTTFPRATASDFERDLVFVYVVSPCGAVRSQSPKIEALAHHLGIHDRFVLLDITWDADVELDQRINPHASLGVPAILAVRQGRAVDMMMGDTPQSLARLQHFLRRNGFGDGPEYVVDFTKRDRGVSRSARLEQAKGTRFHDGDNLAGLDLRGAWFQGGSHSGANFEGADLRGADLRKANLARANLLGARLDGALLDGATWIGAVCPDGTLADDIPTRSCANHITLSR